MYENEIFKDGKWWFSINPGGELLPFTIEMLYEKLAEISKPLPDNKWIIVSEKLPEIPQEVIVYFKNSVGWHVTAAYWDGKTFVELCERCNFKEPFDYVDVIITQWQPLPNSPSK